MPLLPPFVRLLIAVALTSAFLAPSSVGGVSALSPFAEAAPSSALDARAPATADSMIAVRRGAAPAKAAPPAEPPATVSGRSAPAPVPSPRWTWPLSPRPQVIRRFEPPDSPWGPGHRGVDLLATANQPVQSAADGTVTFAGLLAGRGVVAVTHGAVRTTYEPVTATVHVGDHLDAGEPLGTLQPQATHCAPRTCLHWGALRNSAYIDPLQLLSTGRPRLLPLDDQPPTTLRGRSDVPLLPANPPLPLALSAPLTIATALAATTLATAILAESAAPTITQARSPPASGTRVRLLADLPETACLVRPTDDRHRPRGDHPRHDRTRRVRRPDRCPSPIAAGSEAAQCAC